MSDNDNQKPFSRDYVLRTTQRHMLKCINTSIAKTMDRVQEFEGDPEKSGEILKTLSDLHHMRDQLEVSA
jgi:hypothetical protein